MKGTSSLLIPELRNATAREMASLGLTLTFSPVVKYLTKQENKKLLLDTTLSAQELRLPRYYGTDSKIYYSFQVEDVDPDGDCGFHALGLERQDVIQTLLNHKDDPFIRQLVAPEIVARLKSQSLPLTFQHQHPSYLLLERNNQEAHLALDEHVRFINDTLKFEDENRKSAQELQAYLQSHPNSASLSTLLDIALENRRVAEERLQAFCCQPEVFESYIRSTLGQGEWMSYLRATTGESITSTLDAIAYLKNILIKVWQAKEEGSSDLVLVHTCSAQNAQEDYPTAHLLHTNALTHFKILKIIE